MFSLLQNADQIVKNIKGEAKKQAHFHRLFTAYNGNLDPLFDKKMKAFKDPIGKNDMYTHREFSNYFTYAVDKLSQNYNFPIVRKLVDPTDKENPAALTEFEKVLKYVSFNEVMGQANKLINATRACLIEIYHNAKFELCMKAIPNDRFWVWTNDPLDPTTPKVFIKYVGDIEVPEDLKSQFTENKLYVMYTDTEVLQWQSVGRPYKEVTANPLGFAPFYYINLDPYNLIPEKDSSAEGLAIGPSFDITKVNVAAWHQANPKTIIFGMDEEQSKVYNGADMCWVINKAPGQDEVKVQQLPSVLDIDKMERWIKFKIEGWLRNRNVPTPKEGTVDQSALSMLLQGVDTLEARKGQIASLRPADEDIGELLIKYHNWLVKNKTRDLPKRYPKKEISEELKVETEFTLPSAEAEQYKQSKGEDVKLGNEGKEDKANGNKGAPAEKTPADS